MINSPGKILFYGGYSVLFKDHISLSFAVLDKNNLGVYANIEQGEERLISKQFDLDFVPSKNNKELINISYIVAKEYLSSKNRYVPGTIELFNSPIFGNKDEKSGLGSSAAATTTIIKALFSLANLDINFHKETIFKLSQLAYAIYSNKVGSGFDIATSTYERSIIYYRYNPENISLSNPYSSIDKPWDWIKIRNFVLPKNYSLLFFNIKSSKTSTISSVKSFNLLKEKDPEFLNNLMLKQDLFEQKAIESILNKDNNSIRVYTHKAREVHRSLQEKAKGLPIEPEELTNIIDQAEQLPGIIAGRAPGAGGYDGLAFIINNDFNDIDSIIELAKGYSVVLEYIPLKVI